MNFKSTSAAVLSLLAFSSFNYADTGVAHKNVNEAIKRYDEIGLKSNIRCRGPKFRLQSNRQTKSHYYAVYKVQDLEFQFEIKKSGWGAKPKIKGLNRKFELKGKKSGAFYYFNNSFGRLDQATKKMLASYGFVDLKTGQSRVFCSLEDFMDIPITINSENNHINMHPHHVYDTYGLTKEVAQSYINDTGIDTKILLESKGTIRSYQNYSIDDITVEPTDASEIYTASAGNARFEVNVDNVNMVYSGGYANFCIYINSRALYENFIQHSNGGKLTLTYDAAGLTMQPSSVKRNKGMDVGEYTLVKDYFSKYPSKGKSYKNEHFKQIENKFTWLRGMFKEIKLSMNSNGVNKSKTLYGYGERSFEIEIKYINE